MSNKKTININPKLFNIPKNKTQKNNPKNKTGEKINIIPPNLFKSKILKRIQKHKQREINNNNNNNNNNNKTSQVSEKVIVDDDDEFTSSLNYLNNIVKKNNKPKQKTFKKYESSEKTNMNVNIDLPEELEEIKPNNIVLNDVPYGILKKGNKPTYREYYNKTLKNKTSSKNNTINDNNINDNINRKNINSNYNSVYKSTFKEQEPLIQLESTTQVPKKINQPETKIHNEPINQENQFLINVTNNSDASVHNFASKLNNNETNMSNNTNYNVTNYNDTNCNDANCNDANCNDTNYNDTNCNDTKKYKKIIKKTVKKKFTLGKNKNKRKIGVLIKNNKTQKNIMNAYKELKKTSIKEIKDYLYKHNLIKIGSNIPVDVGRQMYEAAKLTGNVINVNSNNILHNLENSNN